MITILATNLLFSFLHHFTLLKVAISSLSHLTEYSAKSRHHFRPCLEALRNSAGALHSSLGLVRHSRQPQTAHLNDETIITR
ncbi:hypothetical protein B0I35DRAFT_250268 [Stachybotrys elegans]|uniref:Secreted protein n=1 Tax=Stachybotrys elegans TaxID=80388 RepID=A0A8K0WS48_9HYPO|nr:hypothetical protein B0I35DRAFT_250268 [Stachybotrys elegans]